MSATAYSVAIQPDHVITHIRLVCSAIGQRMKLAELASQG